LHGLRNPHHAPHKGDVNLSKNKKICEPCNFLGHTKLESTVRYLGIEVDDALEIAEQTEI